MKGGNSKVRKTKCLLFFLALFLLMSCVSAAAASKSDLNDSKEKISDNKEKIKELEKEQQELKEKLAELKSLTADAASYIEELDSQRQELSEKIQSTQEDIEQTQNRIKLQEEELKDTQEQVKEQKHSMALRIRYMYETDREGTLEKLLKSESLAELLNRFEYISDVTEYDREKLEEFRATYEEQEIRKEELESSEEVLLSLKKGLDEELAAIEELENRKSEELKAYEAKITAASEKSQELSTDVSKLQAAIRAEEKKMAAIEAELKRQEEEEKRKALAANGTYTAKTIGDLKFIWPVPSSSRITSTFGQREAPVEGASTTHKGIDIGASSGSSILASESGKVVIAAYSQSAGNYVMLSHGGGIYTVYMHMQDIGVSVGDTVSRGETIGTVGSTGYSTGPHLHFGIRIDGQYVDPQNYVSY